MSIAVISRTALPRCAIATFSRTFRVSTQVLSQELSDDGLPKDYKLKTLKAGSRRLDTQVEKLILGGRVRVNEDVHTKKSYNVQKEDTIDVWIGPCSENKQLADVERYEIVDYEVTEKGYDIQVKSWKKFLVDNWRG
ncbi:hypothetical protein ANCDUO_02778 [Ancylostoma duodenale]|uniref:RNA-binding S4 domain-containing protein n=1 Tax=Ancylostoma duodenale TaxID=51022 RepID=A0A0C2DB01_9BILA|nr:hypothetical protein ANCDUO_02778 [Ancylostoma duodenale]